MRLLLQLLVNGLVNGAVYAMLAIGFGLIWRSLRVFHIAFGGLFVACGYCFFCLVAQVGMHPISAFLGTLLFAVPVGWLCEKGLYLPFSRKGASSGAVLIASLGVSVIIENTIAMIFGNEHQSINGPVAKVFHVGPTILTNIQLFQLLIGFGTLGLLWIAVRHLRVFKALWALGDQPDLIPVLGLPILHLRTLALVFSTILAAASASLVCLDIGIDPYIGTSYLLIGVTAVLLGGQHSYSGWVIGAFILAVTQSLAVWKFSAKWMDLVTFGLLIVILVFRPQGVLNTTRRIENLP